MGVERTWIKRDIKNQTPLKISKIEWEKAREAVKSYISKKKPKPPFGFKFSRKELKKIYPELANEFHHSFIVVSDNEGFKLAAKARSKAYTKKIDAQDGSEEVREGILGHGAMRLVTPIQWEDDTLDAIIIEQTSEKITKKSVDLQILEALGRERGPQFIRTRSEESSWIGTRSIKNKMYTPQEKLKGIDLEKYLMGEGRNINEQQKYEIAKKTAQAILQLHEHNFLHRDIKPANFMIEVNGGAISIKAADFGLSEKLTEGKMSIKGKEKEPVGTLKYMAPEIGTYREGAFGMPYMISKNKQYSTASDVYALGVMFASDLRIAQRNSPLYPLIERMVDQDPKKRPKMTEVLGFLTSPESYKKYKDLYQYLDEYRDQKLMKTQSTLFAFNFGMSSRDQAKMASKLENFLNDYSAKSKNAEETIYDVLSIFKDNQNRHDKTYIFKTSGFNLKVLQTLPEELRMGIAEKLKIPKDSTLFTVDSSTNRKELSKIMREYRAAPLAEPAVKKEESVSPNTSPEL